VILLLTILLAIVAAGRGGYAPWATFVLEVGAVAAVAWLVLRGLWCDGGERRLRHLRHRAWRKLSLRLRYPGLGRFVMRDAPSADIEILMPGPADGDSVELDLGRYLYPFGIPVRRTGLGVPIALVSVWIVLALVPLDTGLLRLVSSEAHRWWSGAVALGGGEPVSAAPWSLVPFLTLRSFWIWIAVVAVFLWVTCVVQDGEAAARLALLLLVVGAISGAYGMSQWVLDFRALFGQQSESLRATGTFGNPNHYAAFQGMLLLVGLGWLAYYRERKSRRGKREPWNTHALAFIAGLAVLLLGLGLVLSLSRSGLAFALVGCASVAFMTGSRGAGEARVGRVNHVGRVRDSRTTRHYRVLLAIGLVVLGVMVWIGIEPMLGRFGGLEEEWAREQGRTAVWRDSLPAVGDFWLTGAGLSSFRYVGPSYRTFGGQIFYSWAHNDYLQLGIELGVPGLLLLLWIGVATVSAARRVRSDLADDPALAHLHAGYVAAVLTVALHSVTDFSLHLPANFALLAIVLAVVVALPASRAKPGS